MPHFDALKIYTALENIVRKGEIACDKQFLLFSPCFLPYTALIFHFRCTLNWSSAICINLDQSNILWSGNGLGKFCHSIYFTASENLTSTRATMSEKF